MSPSKLPTAVTLSRLVFGPVFVICFYVGLNAGDFFYVYLGAVGYCATALTDMADGYLARRLNSVTPLGAILDPVVDIINRTAALAVLTVLSITPWWLIVAYLALVAHYAFETSRAQSTTFTLASSPYGKYVAVAYDVAICAALLQFVFLVDATDRPFFSAGLYMVLGAATVAFIASRVRSFFVS